MFKIFTVQGIDCDSQTNLWNVVLDHTEMPYWIIWQNKTGDDLAIADSNFANGSIVVANGQSTFWEIVPSPTNGSTYRIMPQNTNQCVTLVVNIVSESPVNGNNNILYTCQGRQGLDNPSNQDWTFDNITNLYLYATEQ